MPEEGKWQLIDPFNFVTLLLFSINSRQAVKYVAQLIRLSNRIYSLPVSSLQTSVHCLINRLSKYIAVYFTIWYEILRFSTTNLAPTIQMYLCICGISAKGAWCERLFAVYHIDVNRQMALTGGRRSVGGGWCVCFGGGRWCFSGWWWIVKRQTWPMPGPL